MATLKDIKGTNIQSVDEDPSNPVVGQIWYNSTSRVLKGLKLTTTGSWATGGSLSDARYGFWASFGLQTAAVACGGADSPNEFFATTEEYNGSSWTAGGNIPTAL